MSIFTAVTCDNVPTVSNGAFNNPCPAGSTYLTECPYTCNSGYETSNGVIVCQANQQWSQSSCNGRCKHAIKFIVNTVHCNDKLW